MSNTRPESAGPISSLSKSLEKAFPAELVEEMLRSYDKVQQDYFLADYRPLCIEAARFAEVAIRMLQHITAGRYISLESQIPNFAAEVTKLAQLPQSLSFSDSIRLLIPRTLQIIYDVRNKRNIGHIGGEVDENFADATLAMTCCNWVLAELVRIYHTGDIDEAQAMVDSLIEIKLPMIQDFEGFLKVLDPDLPLPAKILVLLHHRGKIGATFNELTEWIGRTEKTNLHKRLPELIQHGHVHKTGDTGMVNQSSRYYITLAGEKHLALSIRRSPFPR